MEDVTGDVDVGDTHKGSNEELATHTRNPLWLH